MKFIRLLLFFFFATQVQAGVIDDLIMQVQGLEQGEQLEFKYHFVGCYGVYEKGTIRFNVQSDSVYYLSSSFDPQTNNYINQSGKLRKDHLIQALEESKSGQSEEILGNAIHYSFKGTRNSDGYDHIDQKHFIEIFHPFSTFLNKPGLKLELNKKMLKTPGINGSS